MLPETKQVDLALLVVPVAPDSLKAGVSVMERISHNPYLSFGQRNDLLLKIDV
jgi:hypothetical protein